VGRRQVIWVDSNSHSTYWLWRRRSSVRRTCPYSRCRRHRSTMLGYSGPCWHTGTGRNGTLPTHQLQHSHTQHAVSWSAAQLYVIGNQNWTSGIWQSILIWSVWAERETLKYSVLFRLVHVNRLTNNYVLRFLYQPSNCYSLVECKGKATWRRLWLSNSTYWVWRRRSSVRRTCLHSRCRRHRSTMLRYRGPCWHTGTGSQDTLPTHQSQHSHT